MTGDGGYGGVEGWSPRRFLVALAELVTGLEAVEATGGQLGVLVDQVVDQRCGRLASQLAVRGDVSAADRDRLVDGCGDPAVPGWLAHRRHDRAMMLDRLGAVSGWSRLVRRAVGEHLLVADCCPVDPLEAADWPLVQCAADVAAGRRADGGQVGVLADVAGELLAYVGNLEGPQRQPSPWYRWRICLEDADVVEVTAAMQVVCAADVAGRSVRLMQSRMVADLIGAVPDTQVLPGAVVEAAATVVGVDWWALLAVADGDGQRRVVDVAGSRPVMSGRRVRVGVVAGCEVWVPNAWASRWPRVFARLLATADPADGGVWPVALRVGVQSSPAGWAMTSLTSLVAARHPEVAVGLLVERFGMDADAAGRYLTAGDGLDVGGLPVGVAAAHPQQLVEVAAAAGVAAMWTLPVDASWPVARLLAAADAISC